MVYLLYFGTFAIGITLIVWATSGNGSDIIIERNPIFMGCFLITISVIGIAAGTILIISGDK